MSEFEVAKYVVQAGFAGIAAALIVLFWQSLRGNQTSEKSLMQIVQTLVTTISERFGEISAQTQARHEELVTRLMERQDRSESVMLEGIRQVAETVQRNADASLIQMTEITRERRNMLSMIDTNVKTIPAETERLLNEQFKQVPHNTMAMLAPRLDGIKAALDNRITILERRLDAAIDPGAETARALMIADLSETRRTLDLMLTKLSDLETALNKFRPAAADSSESITTKSQPEPAPDDPTSAPEPELSIESSEEKTNDGTK